MDKEGVASAQSPRFFRKKFITQTSEESTSSPQSKVVLGEVEEKLKSMRQKRLDRLSTFITDQTKHLEERTSREQVNVNEIETAILSIKQSKEEKSNTKPNTEELKLNPHPPRTPKLFRKFSQESIIEEAATPKTPVLFRKSSNESMDKSKQIQKPSTTKKFINKFNCTAIESVGSSVEDLTNENSYKLSTGTASTNNTPLEYKENLNNSNEILNPLLSPVGKQRRGVYMYEKECKFLENETVALPKHDEINLEPKENSLYSAANSYTRNNQPVIFEVKLRNSLENRDIIPNIEKKPPVLMKTFKRNSLGDILDNKNVNTLPSLNRKSADDSRSSDKKTNVSKLTNQDNKKKVFTYENVTFHTKLTRNLGKRVLSPKSPLPSPRKISNGERILKKFQRNWDSLNEILDNDSDVDSDEIEDLRKTLEEATTLLNEYSTKLKKLEQSSSNYSNSMSDIKLQLKQVEVEISKFKGLKRDNRYLELHNSLCTCLSQINKIRSSSKEKNLLQKEAENCSKMLERRVARNEVLLFEVLEAQVDSISTNIFNITKV